MFKIPQPLPPLCPIAQLPNCPVSPLDRVTFTPNEISELAPVISGTVFQALDTNLGNWRVRIVREGGLSHTGCLPMSTQTSGRSKSTAH